MTLLERGPFLAELAARLAETRRGGGRLVLLAGEAGIGKTALVDAFVSSLPRGTRVLRGGCDPVVPPRPFAPLHDMAVHAPGGPAAGLAAALASADRDRVFERFLVVARAQGSGGVLVLEDLHWADTATLDLLRILARRLAELPVLVIGTYRGHEIDADHPLRLALGDIPTRIWTELDLPPLTTSAVATLAAGTGVDPAGLHAATGGNPFYVTEVLAAPGREVPTTVRDAVAARITRLSLDAREVLWACAALGARVERSLLDAVFEGRATAGIDEAVAREMLHEQQGMLEFRHELARRSVLDTIRPRDRAGLHRRALAALRAGLVPADAVRLANHAIAAGDARAIATLVPPAAEQAARLGAHDEAADYLAVALALPDAGDDRQRAQLLERYAVECSLADRIAAARSAGESALAIWRDLGDDVREGAALRALATYMHLGGEGDRAREVARQAVRVLEQHAPHGAELGRAYAKAAQLLMDSGHDDPEAIENAGRALAIANDLGDEPTAVHALTTLGALDVALATHPDVGHPWEKLGEALRRATAANLPEDALRILINFVEGARDLKQYDLAERSIERATALLREHEMGLYRDFLRSRVAQIDLERGRWGAAERGANAILEEPRRSNLIRGRALEVVGRLRARRGEEGAMAALDESLALAGPGELQELVPLHAARAEAAWLAGDVERAGDEALRSVTLAEPTGTPSWYGESSFWAWRTGRISTLPEGTEGPYVLHAAGRYREAAKAWAAIGLPYHEATALADSEDERDLLAALALLHGLGATVLAERVTVRLRELGAERIPRGPRPSTRAHAAGLTAREMEVLRLIRRGARNAEIAEALVLSPKTVDHHVSAVLRKLGVPDREAARREADRLGLEDGGREAPD